MRIAGLETCSTVLICLSLAACGNSQDGGGLSRGQSTENGPDEFAIVPTHPLVIPADLATLPKPTSNIRNRTDPLPKHDAVAALGGQPERLDSRAVSASDGPLLAAATRNGIEPNIRGKLAKEDQEFRNNNRPLFLPRLLKINTYFSVYKDQTLDPVRTIAIMRRAGIKTPTAPPVEEK